MFWESPADLYVIFRVIVCRSVWGVMRICLFYQKYFWELQRQVAVVM